jgi:type II secretory pathway component PulC
MIKAIGGADMHSHKGVVPVMVALGLIFCFSQKLLFAEKPVEPASLPAPFLKELRPAVEFTGVESKEPFKDVFYKVPQAVVEVKPVENETQPPLPELTIQGIIFDSSVPCVIMNNVVLREGQSLGEVQVTKIEKEGVRLLYKGWNYTLPSPAASVPKKDHEGGKNEK